MAAGDRAKQKISERAREFIASAPVPQEQILTGAQVISGASRGWALLSPGARMFGRPYYVALTEQHVLFCWMSAWTGKPIQVADRRPPVAGAGEPAPGWAGRWAGSPARFPAGRNR